MLENIRLLILYDFQRHFFNVTTCFIEFKLRDKKLLNNKIYFLKAKQLGYREREKVKAKHIPPPRDYTFPLGVKNEYGEYYNGGHCQKMNDRINAEIEKILTIAFNDVLRLLEQRRVSFSKKIAKVRI